MTTHVLKQTVKVGVVDGFATFGASLGAAGGPASAAIFGTVSGTSGAMAGNWVEDKLIDSEIGDAAITWAADTVDSCGGAIADTLSDIDLPDIDLPDIDMPDVSCCSNPFN